MILQILLISVGFFIISKFTLICFDDSNESFFDLGDIHLQELVGSEG